VDEGVYALHLGGHEELAHVEAVVAVVEGGGAPAAQLRVQSPGLALRADLPAVAEAAGRSLDPDRERRPDGPGLDELLRLPMRGVVHEVLEHAQDPARAFGRLRDPVELLQGPGGRLLERDVFAGLEGGHGMLRVQMMRGQDLDRVHLRVGQESVEVGVDLGSPPGAGALPGPGLVAIADGV
jgi:hypothetical protein